MTTTPRRTVPAAEKARDALGVAERKVKALEDAKAKHQAAINALTPQIADAKATRDYLAQHPALKSAGLAKYEAGE